MAHRALPGASYALQQNLRTGGLRIGLFLSHAWDEGIFEILTNAHDAWPDELAGDEHGAYICFLSNPQVDEVLQLSLGSSIETSPFYRVLHNDPRPKQLLMLANSNTPIHTRLCACRT